MHIIIVIILLHRRASGFAAGLTFVERRLLALWQERYGPNRVGPFGLLQVVADMIKLLDEGGLDSAVCR